MLLGKPWRQILGKPNRLVQSWLGHAAKVPSAHLAEPGGISVQCAVWSEPLTDDSPLNCCTRLP